MPQCPQCNKPLRELTRRCPSCQADLDLLVDFVSHLRGSLDRAEDLTKAGELGQAVWAYLEILEVEPDNAVAKKKVAQVATAVRQFDMTAPGRRWLSEGRDGAGQTKPVPNWLTYLGLSVLILAAFTIGYILGAAANYTDDKDKPKEPEPPPKLKDNSLLGRL
jgi:hypothetical protein